MSNSTRKLVFTALCLFVWCQVTPTNANRYSIHYFATPEGKLSSQNCNHGSQVRKNDDLSLCPPWYDRNISTEAKKCTCRNKPVSESLKCIENRGAFLQIGYCMTNDENERMYSIGKCPYSNSLDPVGNNGYIKLPNNVSELNNYLCHLMNRTGPMCHQCIPGFGPSLTSVKFQCTNCTNVWHGPLLYVLVEIVPITIFYFMILVFRKNITTAPMTGLIMYSQIVLYALTYNRARKEINFFLSVLNAQDYRITRSLLVVYGWMNLEFLHYIVPPFCVSNNLQIVHIVLLGYVSAFYPLCLVILTWLGVELHDRNFRPLVLLWKPFHRYWVKLRKGLNSKHDLIDVFAFFFHLSYSKILYQSILLVACCRVLHVTESPSNNSSYKFAKCYDPSISCAKREHLKITIPAAIVIVVFNILPALLLVLYPFRVFRACLSKCKLDGITITVFVDRFQSCYRDGVNGGRDMRSFSGLYFFLRFGVLIYSLPLVKQEFISINTFDALVSITLALVIASIKPYRKSYMNVFDTMLFVTTTVIFLYSSTITRNKLQVYIVLGLTVLPVVTFMVVASFVTIIKIHRKMHKLYARGQQCYPRIEVGQDDPENQEYASNEQLITSLPVTCMTTYGTCK